MFLTYDITCFLMVPRALLKRSIAGRADRKRLVFRGARANTARLTVSTLANGTCITVCNAERVWRVGVCKEKLWRRSDESIRPDKIL